MHSSRSNGSEQSSLTPCHLRSPVLVSSSIERVVVRRRRRWCVKHKYYHTNLTRTIHIYVKWKSLALAFCALCCRTCRHAVRDHRLNAERAQALAQAHTHRTPPHARSVAAAQRIPTRTRASERERVRPPFSVAIRTVVSIPFPPLRVSRGQNHKPPPELRLRSCRRSARSRLAPKRVRVVVIILRE